MEKPSKYSGNLLLGSAGSLQLPAALRRSPLSGTMSNSNKINIKHLVFDIDFAQSSNSLIHFSYLFGLHHLFLIRHTLCWKIAAQAIFARQTTGRVSALKNHIQNENYKGNEKEAIANKDSGPVKQELAHKN